MKQGCSIICFTIKIGVVGLCVNPASANRDNGVIFGGFLPFGTARGRLFPQGA